MVAFVASKKLRWDVPSHPNQIDDAPVGVAPSLLFSKPLVRTMARAVVLETVATRDEAGDKAYAIGTA